MPGGMDSLAIIFIVLGAEQKYAIAQGHWFFDRSQILGIYGLFSIPLEEYLFFIVVPLAAILTLEGITTVKPHWRKREFGE